MKKYKTKGGRGFAFEYEVANPRQICFFFLFFFMCEHSTGASQKPHSIINVCVIS
jgi:hypothetical protein